MKKSDISEVQYYFSDDEFIHWFICKECDCNRIVYKSNYCPKCGNKLDWSNIDSDEIDMFNKLKDLINNN